SCSGSFWHCHQTFKCEAATTLSGVKSVFLLGCHSAATCGKTVARELVIETFFPAQYGHPVGFSFVRETAEARHSWSEPAWHFHQKFLLEPATTWFGVTSPFCVGCHSAATLGNIDAREFVTDTL